MNDRLIGKYSFKELYKQRDKDKRLLVFLMNEFSDRDFSLVALEKKIISFDVTKKRGINAYINYLLDNFLEVAPTLFSDTKLYRFRKDA